MRTKTAVILAAGKGRRLDKFETIKPLIKVAGKPLIVWKIERLQEAGVEDIYIVVNKEEDLIKRELLHYPKIKAKINFLQQDGRHKNMLGSILSIKGKIKPPFFVTVCDLIFEKNPFKLFKGKEFKKGCLNVLVSIDKKSNDLSGASGRILYKDKKIINTGTRIKKHNGLEVGIYHFDSRAYKDFCDFAKKKEAVKKKSLNEVLSLYVDKHQVIPVVMKNCNWFDINIPATLVRAELFLRDKNNSKDKKQNIVKARKLKKSAFFENRDPLTYEVNVKKGIINNLEDYEIIPYEFYRSPHHLIVDKNIDDLYGKKIHQKLISSGYKCNKILVDAGEWTKSVDNYIKIANEILNSGIDKKSIIISLGGGVIKDLAGFLASSLYRGIGFISIPTTIMSQADAAIGLKQGVNGEGGKNLLGSFYAPMKIVVDPELLLTLEDRYISDGLAECLKVAFSSDKNYYDFFANYNGNYLKDVNFLEEAVKRSIELKVASTQNDYFEEKEGLVNQYGHEIGHAVEYLSGYKLGHGEAIAIGMRVSAEIAYLLGLAKKDVVDAHIFLTEKFDLSTRIPKDIKAEDIIDTLRYNKKFHGGEARLALVNKIGSLWKDKQRNVYTLPVDNKILKKAIKKSYV